MSRPKWRSAFLCGWTVRVPRSQPPAYGMRNRSVRCSSGPRNMITLRVRRAASVSIAARSSAAGVEQGRAQQRHAGVLAGLDVYGAGQPPSADHPQVHRAGVAQGDDLAVERLADPRDHLKADVLVTALDTVHRALAGTQRFRELGLCPATMLSRVTDEPADAYEVIVGHMSEAISNMR